MILVPFIVISIDHVDNAELGRGWYSQQTVDWVTQCLADAAESIYAELGRKLVKTHVPASSDANWISQKVPTLEGLGISNANPHQKNEYSSVKPAPDRLYLLARLIQETCRGNTVPLGAK